jgi:PAS domain S-box-containing protein
MPSASADPSASTPAGAPAANAAQQPSCRPRVLVVEQDEEVRKSLMAALCAAGLAATGATTRDAGLAALEEMPPQLVLLDVQLPGVDACDFCRQLKADTRYLDIAVLFVRTGNLTSEDQRAAFEAGAQGYILRPISDEDLISRVHAVLRARQNESELRRLTAKLATLQRRIEQSEQRYKSLFDRHPDAACSFDRQGRLHSFNRAAEVLMRYPAEDLLFTPFQRMLVPEERSLAEADFARILAGESTCREVVIACGDGSHCRAKVTGMPVVEDGEITGMFCIAQDVTERRESEERFQQLAENVEDAFWIVDVATQRILYSNPAFHGLSGFPDQPADIHAYSHLESVHPEDCERVVTAFAEAPWAVNMEYRRVACDGATSWFWIRTFPIHDDEGQVSRIGGIARDITERKKLDNQFLRAQRMEGLGTLAGGIAHDLNNVLAPVILSIALLKTRTQDAMSLEVLDTVEDSARRGADLVRQVLSFARGVEGQRLSIPPRHLLKEIRNIVADAFPKNIQCKLTCTNQLWNVLGDPTQLHQVLLNLCVNARDAMPDGGEIEISAENVTFDAQYAAMQLDAKAGPYVVIRVTDTGTGISTSDIERIFDPFFTTKETGKGSGLGLSTSLAIVKSHGGFILVDSNVGQGTTFTVHLPANPESAEESSSGLAALPRGNGQLVLLVDDEAHVRTVTQQTLEMFGYRVVCASDGVQAVAIYAQRQEEIGIVLTDMMMPIMDGSSTIQVLTRINPLVKIVAASGLSNQGPVARGASPGVREFIPKPYTTEVMLRTLARVLAEP